MPDVKTVFLLAGHGARRSGGDPLLKRVVAETETHQPRVAYLGSASGDNRPFYLAMAAMLRASGCGAVTLAPTVGKRVNLDNTLAILQDSELIFVSGGDVEEGMRVLEGLGLTAFLHELYEAGKVFCGASAGSIMLAREWVRWPDPSNDDSAQLFPCLNIAKLLCDTHGEGEGWEELQTALRLSPEGTIGYGIRSGACLAQHPDGSLEVSGGVVDTFIKAQGKVVPSSPLKG